MIVSSVVKEQFEKAAPKSSPKKPRLNEKTKLRAYSNRLEKDDLLEFLELKSHCREGEDLSDLRISKSRFSGDMFLGC